MTKKFLFSCPNNDTCFDGYRDVVVELNASQVHLLNWLHNLGLLDDVVEYRSIEEILVSFAGGDD